MPFILVAYFAVLTLTTSANRNLTVFIVAYLFEKTLYWVVNHVTNIKKVAVKLFLWSTDRTGQSF